MDEIKIINNIIVEAILHGADPGGSYDMNEEALVDSIESWIKFKHIQADYHVCNVKVFLDDKCYLECPQIQKIESRPRHYCHEK